MRSRYLPRLPNFAAFLMKLCTMLTHNISVENTIEQSVLLETATAELSDYLGTIWFGGRIFDPLNGACSY